MGKPCIARNILKDPSYAPWRREALKRGYASSVALPLIAEGQTLGALNIYSAEPDAFDEKEVHFLSELANDLAYGILTLRTRTAREEAEKKAKKCEDFSENIIENAQSIIVVLDKQGNVVSINPYGEELLGYNRKELLGKNWFAETLRSKDRAAAEEIFKNILAGLKAQGNERTLLTKDKRELIVSWDSSRIQDGEGDTTGVVAVGRDVTSLKKAEEAQRLAELGKLVAGMAHEVNNPLMVISGRAQLSLTEEIKNEAVVKNLKIIFQEAQRAKDIIQRLLKFSRPSKGEIKEIDINKSLEEVVSIIEHQFKLNNITIKKNYGQGLPLVLIDEKQIQEVFMNLLNNAGDAISSPGGQIQIITSQEENFVKIEIKDSGSGMDKETLSKIFEPFFTTKEKGTGLGLSICYSIIKHHNGELKFESSPGQGTVATILLPVKEKDNA